MRWGVWGRGWLGLCEWVAHYRLVFPNEVLPSDPNVKPGEVNCDFVNGIMRR